MDGAWNSEYFEKEPARAQRPEPLPREGPVAPVPPIYNNPKSGGAANVAGVLVSLLFRILTLVLAVVALLIMVMDKKKVTVEYAGRIIHLDYKFNILTAYKFVVIANGIACIYSLVLILLSSVLLCCGKAAQRSYIAAWLTFATDQAMAYFLLAAGAVGAAAAYMGQTAETFFIGFRCSDLGITGFCTKAEISVGLTFGAFLFLALTAVLSSRHLFRQ